MIKFSIYLYLLIILVSCSSDKTRKSKSQNVATSSKSISIDNYNVKIKLEDDKMSFEILNGKRKRVLTAANEYGKLTFTSSLPIISYSGDSIQVIEYFFYKNDFLIFPLEDWNGKRIFYKIPLNENSRNDTIYPFFILKEQYCLFNQRTATLLMYEELKTEYFIDERAYFLTNLNLVHFENRKKVDSIQFYTQKEIGITEDMSPISFKNQLLNAVSQYYNKSIFDAYFK